MTRQERAILQLMAVAEEAGLDAVVELPDDGPPSSVDLRVVNRGRVAAAIRVHLGQGTWRYEVPARPGGEEPLNGVRTRHLADARRSVSQRALRALDYYFARARGRAEGPRPPVHPKDTPVWMRPAAERSEGSRMRGLLN